MDDKKELTQKEQDSAVLKLILGIMLVLLLFRWSAVEASMSESCPEVSHPRIVHPPIPMARYEKSLDICFSDFGINFSPLSKSANYSVEKANRLLMIEAFKIPRVDRFYEEARLPSRMRARLSDYRNSDFDRGHLAPAASRYTPEGMAQSFSLANIVPQKPATNRKVIARVEEEIRKFALRRKTDVYVITGPLYSAHKSPALLGKNGPWIPDYMFKVIYDQHYERAWAYFIYNDGDEKPVKPMAYKRFVDQTGLNFLPHLYEQ